MTAGRELLDRLAEIGATVRAGGDDHLIVRAGATPVPAELVQQLRQAKAEVLAALAAPSEGHNAAWWRDFFEERAAHLEIDAGYPRIEAEMRAFSECVAEWHLRHDALPEPVNCLAHDFAFAVQDAERALLRRNIDADVVHGGSSG